MWEECHVERESVKAPAEELGWSLASGRGDLSGLSNDEKTGLKWIRRGLIDLSTISHSCTHHVFWISTPSRAFWL